MNLHTVLEHIKTTINDETVDKKEDARCTKISFQEFVSAVIMAANNQSAYKRSIESIRNRVNAISGKDLKKSSFYDRLSTKKLNLHLRNIINTLIKTNISALWPNEKILEELGVDDIELLDSTSSSLCLAASEFFPSTRTNVINAQVKLHVSISLKSFDLNWYNITPGTTSDIKAIQKNLTYKGKLSIADLGYTDYQRIKDINNQGGYFLSRIKSNAKVTVCETVKNISKSCINHELHSGRFDAYRGKSVIAIGYIIIPGTQEKLYASVYGTWSLNDHGYHWYFSNIKQSTDVIYTLYRIRWQIELLFKSLKGFFKLDHITTGKKILIENLMLLSICAHLIANKCAVSIMQNETKEKQAAFSVLRVPILFCNVTSLLFEYLISKTNDLMDMVIHKMQLFKNSLFDPNYKKRKNTLTTLAIQLGIMN